MKKIGITGRNGFVGTHLYNTLSLLNEEFEIVDCSRAIFEDSGQLNNFVRSCDVIVHLAALNRHSDQEYIYETNIGLVKKLIDSLEGNQVKPHILFSSSSQEENNNLYGKSKKNGRELLLKWAIRNNSIFTGMVVPNVFGAFGKPHYNSFIATFCYQLTHGEIPKIDNDGKVKLIYVQELVDEIIRQIRNPRTFGEFVVQHTAEKKVSEVLVSLENYKTAYFEKGEIPLLNSTFEINLFNTFRSFIDQETYYPVKFNQHIDGRGIFVEIIRLGVGGQVSFSTTKPGVTRGNHFHIRKIERFAVIKGKALVQLRRVDCKEVLEFFLDGYEPSYVDMPIWYTHNIKNIGKEELYTIFWINEVYNSEDADTYFAEV